MVEKCKHANGKPNTNTQLVLHHHLKETSLSNKQPIEIDRVPTCLPNQIVKRKSPEIKTKNNTTCMLESERRNYNQAYNEKK